jgi:hypothetical protein
MPLPKCRKNYAGTAPITKASGKQKVVLARFVRNRHLADATYLWAFCTLTQSPGATTTRVVPTAPTTTRPCVR